MNTLTECGLLNGGYRITVGTDGSARFFFPSPQPSPLGRYVFSPHLPTRQDRGLQAASPSALADRKGIWPDPLDRPTRKRRKRRARAPAKASTWRGGSPRQAEVHPPVTEGYCVVATR